MSTRVRRPPDGPSRAPSHPGPSAPPRTRRLKKRHHTGLIVLALIIGSSIYASNRSHHDHPSPIQHDRADLSLVPGAVSVPAGGTGNVNIRLGNAGPDNLAHTVTFTITTSDRLAIAGPGRVADNGLDDPFAPDADCKISSGGRLMRCEAFVTVSVGQQVVWTVPVRVTAGAPLGASETLTVTAVGNSLYTDSNAGNNRDIAYPVVVGRPGAHEPVPSTAAPSTPAPSAPPYPAVRPPSRTPRRASGSAMPRAMPSARYRSWWASCSDWPC